MVRARRPSRRGDGLTYRRPGWLAYQVAECRAVRERAGLLDMSSFAKYEVRGPGAAALPRPAVRQPPAERRAGGPDPDAHAARRDRVRRDDHPPRRRPVLRHHRRRRPQTQDLDWIDAARCRPTAASRLEDVTGAWGVLMLAGPRARDILGALTDADLSTAGLPVHGRPRHPVVGPVPVRALRVTYTGELGWELHHPIEYSRTLYDLLLEAGEPLRARRHRLPGPRLAPAREGLPPVGRRHRPADTPARGGPRAVRRASTRATSSVATPLVRQRDEGVGRRLACLTIDLRARRRPVPPRRRAGLRDRTAWPATCGPRIPATPSAGRSASPTCHADVRRRHAPRSRDPR